MSVVFMELEMRKSNQVLLLELPSRTGKLPRCFWSTYSSTLPSSNASITTSHRTTTSSSMYSTGLFPVNTLRVKIPNLWTSHLSVILTVWRANSGVCTQVHSESCCLRYNSLMQAKADPGQNLPPWDLQNCPSKHRHLDVIVNNAHRCRWAKPSALPSIILNICCHVRHPHPLVSPSWRCLYKLPPQIHL